MKNPMPTRNDVGQTVAEMPSGRHPDSHFETRSIRIEPASNGGFTVERHVQLKKKYDGMRHMEGGYREPEKMVFGDADSMHAHLQSMFKPLKKAAQGDEK